MSMYLLHLWSNCLWPTQLRSNNGLVACCIINGKEYRWLSKERRERRLIIQNSSLVLFSHKEKDWKGHQDTWSKHKVEPTSSHLWKCCHALIWGRSYFFFLCGTETFIRPFVLMPDHLFVRKDILTFGIWKTRKNPRPRTLNHRVSQVPRNSLWE